MKITSASVAFLFLLLFSCEGRASVFGFAADPDFFITNYQGFTFSGNDGPGSWVNGTLDSLSPAPAAPLGYAWSNGAANLSMQSPEAFAITSVDVYGFNGTQQALTIEGFRSGVLIDSLTTVLLTTSPIQFSTVALGWADVDELTFSTNFQEVLLLTDFNVTTAVPEPSTWAMMILGFAGVGFMAYRRKLRPALMAA
jgi:hypothetical protein